MSRVPGGLGPTPVPILQLIWPAGAPPGPYTFFGALTAASAFNGTVLDLADVVGIGLAGVNFSPWGTRGFALFRASSSSSGTSGARPVAAAKLPDQSAE